MQSVLHRIYQKIKLTSMIGVTLLLVSYNTNLHNTFLGEAMIQIIGAGAIGCLWLAKLRQVNYECHLVSRSQLISPRVKLTDLTGHKHLIEISHSNQLLHSSEKAQKSTILVCVKAQQVLKALLMQRQYISDQQPLILMHNGFGCAEEVIKHFPNNPIICATTANASLYNNALDITETGNGPSYFGLFKETADDLSPLIIPFQRAMKSVYWSESIIEKCWLKLAINAAINPLTAIHQIKNGALQSIKYQSIITPLIKEVATISEYENINLNLDILEKTIMEVIKATAENFSSMNRDIFYKRETEIDFINGYLIKKAQQHKIVTPLLMNLYQQVKAMESH